MFKRFLRISESNINSVIDRLEDPIKMTEQGIRDLKKEIGAAMQSLAQVKSMAIRTRKEADAKINQARDYENKAKALLLNARDGALDTIEAERLATLALEKQTQALADAERLGNEALSHETMAADLDVKVNRLRSTLNTVENELTTLKARSKTAISARKINARLTSVDPSGTIAMLERMKERVEEDEALAKAYEDLAAEPDTLDSEIDQLLSGNRPKGSARLEELKQQMAADKAPNGESLLLTRQPV